MKRTKFTRLAGSLIWLPFMCLPLMGQTVVRNEVQAVRPPDGTRPAKAEIREPGEPAASGGLQLRADVRAWPDSTVTFTAAGERQSKAVYTYDAAGRPTLSESYRWEANRWVNSSKTVYERDAAGRTTLYEGYRWEGGTWVNSYKYVYAYDAAGHQILSESYNGEGDTWAGSSKSTHTYDDRGVEILWGQYKWADSQWVKTREEHYERKSVNSKTYIDVSVWYNDDGSRSGTAVFVTGSGLNVAMGQMEEQKMEYKATFDANGNVTLVEITVLVDGKRVPSARYVLKYSNDNPVSIEVYGYYDNDISPTASMKASNTYDARGNLTLSESYHWGWDSETEENKWIGYNKEVNTYDANGKGLSYESYIWDGGWVGSYKSAYTYDTNGRELSDEYYTWDTSSGGWTGSDRYTYEKRNAYGDVILRYNWSWLNNSWEWTTYTVSYPGGSEPNATEHIGDAEPSVYAHGGSLHIRTVRAERTDIYTLDGARVYGRQVPAGTTTLPLPPGMYIVKVGNATEKIVIGK